MNVLVLGGTGFVNAAVVRRLATQGHAVTVFHRGETQANLPASVAHLHGDRTALPAFATEFRRFAPEVALDGICYTEAEARAAVEVFSGLARRLVVLSSADVYRNYDGLRGLATHPPDAAPLAEDAPLRAHLFPYRAHAESPRDRLYDYDKILVERAARSAPDLPATVLRLPAVFGPGDPQQRLAGYLEKMDTGLDKILLEEDQARWRWTRGYVENVAAAIVLAVTDERAAGRTYNVGEAEALTEAAWVRQIGTAAGWQGTVRAVPKEDLPEKDRQPHDWRYHLATDTRRLRDELGFAEPVPHAEALRRTVAWQRRRFTAPDA